MATLVKANEIPDTPKKIYIHLYCKLKDSRDEQTVHLAKKSWETLSKKKRQHFEKLALDKKVLINAHTLKNSKPYLRQRSKRISKNRNLNNISGLSTTAHQTLHDSILTNKSACELNETSTLNTAHDTKKEYSDEENNSNIGNNTTSRNESHDESMLNVDNHSKEEIIEADIQDSKDVADALISESRIASFIQGSIIDNESNAGSEYTSAAPSTLREPDPPVVKSGKDLFHMIKTDGSKWENLTIREKRQYHGAVRKIKRDYISNYTKYLESLNKEQLFRHYMQTLHSK